MQYQSLSSKKLYEKTQDLLDSIGVYWTSNKRFNLILVLTIYYILQLTFQIINNTSISSSENTSEFHSYQFVDNFVIFIDVLLILSVTIFLIICWIDFFIIEKYFAVFDTILLSFVFGWLLCQCFFYVTSMYIIFILINTVCMLTLIFIDVTTERMKYSSPRPLNFRQFYRSLRTQQFSQNTVELSKDLPTHTNSSLESINSSGLGFHDFQLVSPTVNDTSHIDIDILHNNGRDLHSYSNNYSINYTNNGILSKSSDSQNGHLPSLYAVSSDSTDRSRHQVIVNINHQNPYANISSISSSPKSPSDFKYNSNSSSTNADVNLNPSSNPSDFSARDQLLKNQEKNTQEQEDDEEKIEFDGFRVKMDSLSPGLTPAQYSVSWDSLQFIEHRIDSSSCHIYTAIWQNTPVIIKLIKADRVTSPMALAEFEMEANVLSRIRHANIVRLLGAGKSCD